MNSKSERVLLHKIHLFLCESIEKNCLISFEDIGNMFAQIFNNDIRYIKYCPEALEESLIELSKELTNPSDDLKASLKILLVSFYAVHKFENLDKNSNAIDSLKKDQLCFKAALGEFQIQCLLLGKMNAYVKFKAEYMQIGQLMSQYYLKNNSENVSTIKSMIKSKLDDLYNRYEFSYPAPLCAV